MYYPDNIKHTYAHIKILTLEELRVLPECQDYDCGIYFLWGGPELLYIGKSRNVPDRIQRLTQAKRCSPFYQASHKAVPFDRHTVLVLANSPIRDEKMELPLQLHERAYIDAYRPPYNFDRASGLT